MINLDDTDMEILRVIKNEARLSTRKIAKKAKVPIATVNRRMNKLIENGIIKRFVTELDYEKLGRTTTAYILIRAAPGANQNDLLSVAEKYEVIEDIAAIAGQFDILIKVRVKDNDALSDFLFNEVRNFPSVAQTQTLLALNLKTFQKRKGR